jgi:hypothetical protein
MFQVLVIPLFLVVNTLSGATTNQSPSIAWGVPAESFQLGIRIKGPLAPVKPVEAEILTRNVTKTNLPSYFGEASGPNGTYYDGYSIFLMRGTNPVPSLIKRTTDPWLQGGGTGSGATFEMPGGEVQTHAVRLDKEYGLKPQIAYSVCASRQVRKLKGEGTTEIKSRSASFTLPAPSGKVAQTNTPAAR